MADPVPCRTNADGSITILGFAHTVRIGPREAHVMRMFGPRDAAGDWAGPEPSTCGQCGAHAAFQTRSEPRRAELVFIHYRCGACGAHDIEPFD